jgi:hypothetical protein
MSTSSRRQLSTLAIGCRARSYADQADEASAANGLSMMIARQARP